MHININGLMHFTRMHYLSYYVSMNFIKVISVIYILRSMFYNPICYICYIDWTIVIVWEI